MGTAGCPPAALADGLFSFTSLFTDLPGESGTGSPFASFLLGQVQTFSIDVQPRTIRPRAHAAEFFVQDDWKLSNRITANVGVRYTLNFPSTTPTIRPRFSTSRRSSSNSSVVTGTRDRHASCTRFNFGPRAGVSFRVTDRTVARAGYGLIWIEQAGITTPFTAPQFPFIQTVSERTLDSIAPAFVLADGPRVVPFAIDPDAGLGQGVFAVDRSRGSGYAQQWNAAVQRELGARVSLEAAYAGSRLIHIGVPDTNLNQLTVDQLALGDALLQRVPNPFYGAIPRSSSLGDETLTVAQLLEAVSALHHRQPVSEQRRDEQLSRRRSDAASARRSRPQLPGQLHPLPADRRCVVGV